LSPTSKVEIIESNSQREDDRKVTFYFNGKSECHTAVYLLEEQGFGPVETSTMEKDGFFWATVQKTEGAIYVVSSIAY
jgi:hypothetical protein